jgi:hypothetical protein
VKWIAARPGFVERWYEDDVDPGDYVVDEFDNVDAPLDVARVLLGEADPPALTVVDKLHDEGWSHDPPHWSGERLRAFRDALGRIPDTRGPQEGYWRLDDAAVEALSGKLSWTRRYADSPVEARRQSVKAEWNTARQLHTFLAEAVAAGYEVIAD